MDLDLHVIEPGGKEIYWEDPKGQQGGELDVDNTKGFGPENIYWLVESKAPAPRRSRARSTRESTSGTSSTGAASAASPKPTHWQVRVKHDGKVTVYHGKFKALNERSKIYTLKVDSPPCFGSRAADESPPQVARSMTSRVP